MKKQAAKSDVRIEYVDLDEVQRWPRNPKQHAEKPLIESVARFGFVEPLIMDESTGRIVAGHGRLEALQKMRAVHSDVPAGVQVDRGKWKVPVIRGVKFTSEREAEAYLLATNRLVESGGWDEGALLVMLADIQKDTPDLSGIGWDASDIDALSAFSALDDHAAGAADASVDLPVGWQPPEVKARVIITCPDWEAVRNVVTRLGMEYKEKQVTYDYSDLKSVPEQ